MENVEIDLHHRELSHALPEISHALTKAKAIDQGHAGQENPGNWREQDRSGLSLP
jgi:hypothetical protein